MTAENYMRVMQRAETKKLGDSVYRYLSFLCLRASSANCVTLPNDVMAKALGVCERSIMGWTSTLVGEDILNVVYNRHKKTRYIYINHTEKAKGQYVEPAYKDLTEAQRKFKDRYPNRAIDCDVPDAVDMDRLLAEMELSQHLKTCDNMSLKSCVIKHYDLILKGFWRDSKYKFIRNADKQSFIHGREYTKEEMDSLFQKIEDIEV